MAVAKKKTVKKKTTKVIRRIAGDKDNVVESEIEVEVKEVLHPMRVLALRLNAAKDIAMQDMNMKHHKKLIDCIADVVSESARLPLVSE